MYSIGTTSSRHSQGFGKSYTPQVPKGFTVRVFKGPALSSFSHPASAKFDLRYHTIPLAEPRQSQNWYPPRSQATSNSVSAPGDPQKSSRSQTTDNSTSSTTYRRGGHESNSRSTAPSYSFYQSSKDTYVYEPSLSSKSDIGSNSEYDDASTTAFTPSSAFSPAMSTDSITTIRDTITPDASLTDLHSTTPTSFRNPIPAFPIHIPGLSQAQSALRGIFRSQTPQEGQSTRTDTYPPHAPSARPTPLPGSVDAGRSAAPIRLSTTSSGSADRTIPNDAYSTTSSSGQPAQSYARARSPISESEDNELDRVARANAEYNAASSASSSAYYSARDPANFPAVSSGAPNIVGDAGRQFYPNLPLRSSPEQQHASVHNTSLYTADATREPSSYYMSSGTTGGVIGANVQPNSGYPYALSESEGTVTTQSDQFIPPLGEWVENRERRQANPVRRQSEERSPTQIPEFRNEGPFTARYVPASRTMLPSSQPLPLSTTSSEPVVIPRENDRPLPVPPPPTTQPRSSQRERRSSISQPPVSSTSSLFYASQENGASSHRPGARDEEPRRRSPIEPLSTSHAPYASSRPSDLPPSRELPTSEMSSHRSPSNAQPIPIHASPSLSLSTSPEQMHRLPSTHYVAPSQEYVPAPAPGGPLSNNSATVQQPSTSAQAAPLRTSPEQMHMLPSAHHVVPEAQGYASVPSSVGVGSKYVGSSATRRPSMSAPQGRRNSIVMPTLAAVDPRVSEISITTPSQSRPQQDVQNSPPRPQRSGYNSRDPHTSGSFTNPGSRNPNAPLMPTSHPVHPPQPLSASTSRGYTAENGVPPARTRYNSDQRPFDIIPNQQPFAPPSVSSDPGPERNNQRMPFLEPQRTGGDGTSYSRSVPVAGVRALPIPVASSGTRPETVSMIPESDGSRSRTPFQDTRRPPEPQRRHSDGEQPIASSSYPPPHSSYLVGASTSAVPVEQQPQRRYSDGDQIDAPERKALAIFRTVRWNENLVCPSPIFPHQRRRGWFNRRGDQLWTNDGAYKPAPAGQEYPPDLDGYPEHGEGWMNEESVRIDMGHRLIPKAPLKSALKQTRPQQIQPSN